MTATKAPSKLRIGISNAADDDYLVMMVAYGTSCQFHQISLVDARLMSLELIKHVYKAELRKNLHHSPSPSRFTFQPKPRMISA